MPRLNSECIQLLDGHKIPMIRESGAMVLNATVVDKSDMRIFDLVALVVQIEVSAAVGKTRTHSQASCSVVYYLLQSAHK